MPIQSLAASRSSAKLDLLANLVRKDIKVRYMGTSLGIVWSLINPVLTILTYLTVFTLIFPSPVDRFALYLITGVVHWTLFSQIISQGSEWLTMNSHLLKKIYFPRLLAPLAGVLTLLAFWSASLAVYLLLYPAMGGTLSPALLAYPLVLAALLLSAFGISLMLAVMHVHYRDIRHISDALLPLLFWLTPIVWIPQSVSPALMRWLDWNPVLPYFRSLTCILHDGQLPSTSDSVLMLAMSACALCAGLILFITRVDEVIEQL